MIFNYWDKQNVKFQNGEWVGAILMDTIHSESLVRADDEFAEKFGLDAKKNSWISVTLDAQ